MRDFRHVRDEIRTKPHRIGSARLARFRRALLGGGDADTRSGNREEQRSRQHDPASEAHGTQHLYSSWGFGEGGVDCRGRSLKHHRKTENQFSEKFR
jgi:hypothetical protein